MRIKLFRVRSSVAVVIAAAWLAALAPAHGQRPAASAAKWTPDRTPDGQPDMQGIYNRSGVGGLDPGALEAQGHRPENPIDPSENNPLSVSNRPDGLANVDRGFGEAGAGARQRGPRRPGGIVDPPNKILPWKPEEDAKRRDFLLHTNPVAGLRYVETDARCALPGLFLGGGPYQFLQPPGAVVILSEYSHFTRVIHLDGRPHLGKNLRLFLGDSVGHWEGNTLVVDTTNYNGLTAYSREIPYLSDALRTVERFTITDAKTIDYEVTIDDPKLFTKTWKVAGVYSKTENLTDLLEYACAEGSQTLVNIFGEPPGK